MNFKKKNNIEKRKSESLKIRTKYPNKIPVIVERGKKSNLNAIDKNKYLVPEDLTMGQFLYVVRKRIQLDSEQALFCFVNDNTLPTTSSAMVNIYNDHKDEDGFLYVTYCSENTFG